MKLIDFDKIYNDYVIKWTKKNIAKLQNNDPLKFVDTIYKEWKETPLKEINNLTVTQYFDNFNINDTIELLKGYNNACLTTPSPLIDKLCRKEYEDSLVKLLLDYNNSEELILMAANILEEQESKKHIGILAEILLDINYKKEVRELAIEILAVHATEVKDRLLPKINGNFDNDAYIADVLAYCKNDETIFNLLEKLFKSGKDYQLYAAYLGMYDDERALPHLQKRLKSEELGYVEFLEIRNAIERLGGEVTEQKDFSFDPD